MSSQPMSIVHDEKTLLIEWVLGFLTFYWIILLMYFSSLLVTEETKIEYVTICFFMVGIGITLLFIIEELKGGGRNEFISRRKWRS